MGQDNKYSDDRLIQDLCREGVDKDAYERLFHLIGCDLNDIKGNALELMQNKELIAVDQDPLGLQAYVVKRENGGYVLVKDVEEKYGTKRVVAFYNPTNGTENMSVDFSQLDLSGEVKVRDLFAKAD